VLPTPSQNKQEIRPLAKQFGRTQQLLKTLKLLVFSKILLWIKLHFFRKNVGFLCEWQTDP
jgi:hypothetical protein